MCCSTGCRRAALSGALVEFLVFGLKQAWACLFGGAMLALIIGTRLWWPDEAPLARYDFLFLAALVDPDRHARLQAGNARRSQGDPDLPRGRHGDGDIQDVGRLVDLSGGELLPDRRRAAVLRLHVCGGRLLPRPHPAHLRHALHRYPPLWTTVVLCVADLRQLLRASFHAPTCATCCSRRRPRSTCAPSSTTASSASATACRCCSASCWWRCSSGSPKTSAPGRAPGSIPDRQTAWTPVSIGKLGAWYLLMIISFVLVSLVHRPGLELPPRRRSHSARSACKPSERAERAQSPGPVTGSFDVDLAGLLELERDRHLAAFLERLGHHHEHQMRAAGLQLDGGAGRYLEPACRPAAWSSRR